LESTAYFQKSRSVDEYLDEFQDLITEAGYSNPKTIVVKLCRGLDTQIQNAIATMPSGRPSDMVPMDWYTTARTLRSRIFPIATSEQHALVVISQLFLCFTYVFP